MKFSLSIPLFLEPVSAGFPSPSENYMEKQLNLHEFLVSHQTSTFFVRAEGDSMIGTGIFSGDLLVVDRSLEAVHNKVVIAAIDGELTVKRLIKYNNKTFLKAENPQYKDIVIEEGMELNIWGVVTSVIHQL